MSRAWPWSLLGLSSKAQTADIRKAYAAKLRAMNPDDDPAAFANLRQARDHALRLAKERAAREEARAQAAERGDAADPEAGHDDASGEDISDYGWYDPDDFDEPAKGNSPPNDGGIELAVEGAPLAPPALPDHDPVADGVVTGSPAIAAEDFHVAMGAPEIHIGKVGDASADPLLPAHPVVGAPVLGGDRVTDSVDARGVDDHSADRLAVRYALEDLLYADDRTGPLDGAEARRLLAIILTDPALDRVDDQLAAEQYLAQIVANTLPRSAPLVRPLADHFGWRAEAKTINQSGAISLLADHALAQDFRERIERPDNKGYKAWRALTTPGPVAWYNRKPPYLNELMQVIREQHPLLERDYDPQRFDYWVNRTGKGDRQGGSNWGWAIIGAILMFAIIGSLNSTDAPENASDRHQEALSQLEDFDDPLQRRRTITNVLQEAGGTRLTAEAMISHDQGFMRVLDERLLSAKSEVGRLEDTEPLLARLLAQRIRGALADVQQSELVAFRRAQADLAEARLKVVGPNTSCNDIVHGSPINMHLFPLELRDAWQEGQRRMLLGSRAPVAGPPNAQSFNLLTTTWADAQREAGLAESEFFASFRGDRGEAEYCRTYVALLRTALARPGDPDRLDVLRRL